MDIKVLGVRFDPVTRKEALDKFFFLLKDGKQHQVVTPNPEILLKAKKDEKYRQILNRADLSVADGTGVLWASGLGSRSGILRGIFHAMWDRFDKILPERVAGADLMKDFLDKVYNNDDNVKVFLLGGTDGVANTVKDLYTKDGHSFIAGTYEGSSDVSEDDKIVSLINTAKPDVLFVAYGSPPQEKWIYRNLKKMPSVKVAMGVGGAFDFISGKVKRAPVFMRKAGLEWLWRFFKQPSRIRRIWNAVFVFPYTIMVGKINLNIR